MKTRELIRECAAQNGWEQVESDVCFEVYERAATVDPGTPLGKIVALATWEPRDRISVEYNGSRGERLWQGWYHNPGDQAFITGKHVGEPSRVTTGRDQRNQIIGWLQEKP